MSISDMTALELGRRIQSGDITAVQAAEASLARIKAMEPSVHAFVTVNEEKTMEQAGKVQADSISSSSPNCSPQWATLPPAMVTSSGQPPIRNWIQSSSWM